MATSCALLQFNSSTYINQHHILSNKKSAQTPHYSPTAAQSPSSASSPSLTFLSTHQEAIKRLDKPSNRHHQQLTLDLANCRYRENPQELKSSSLLARANCQAQALRSKKLKFNYINSERFA